MQTITSPEDLRRASGRAARAAAGVAALASLLVLGVAPRVRAQQIPQGCSGTGLTINSPFVERANGNNAGAGSAVSPCETLLYKGSLTGGSPPACCFQGGTPIITTPRTCASNADCADNPSGTCGTEIAGRCSYDVTPPGGVPEICPGDPAIDTLTLQYQVRSQDVDVNGRITARFHFTAGESLTGTPPIMGVPSGSTSGANTAVPCPPGTPCLTSICDPNLQGTGADGGRKGLCTTTNVTDSTPCAADNAGNPVTAIPGSCKTPGCEAGECVPAQINVIDSTPCTDTDNNVCTRAGCEEGSCVQTHVTTTCADPICQQCDTSTGLCGPITPTPPQCVGHPPPTTTTSSSTTTTTTTLPGCADFPCGDDGWAVSICHIPPGNPRKSQTLCIGSDAVSSHLNHGDHCGPCR